MRQIRQAKAKKFADHDQCNVMCVTGCIWAGKGYSKRLSLQDAEKKEIGALTPGLGLVKDGLARMQCPLSIVQQMRRASPVIIWVRCRRMPMRHSLPSAMFLQPLPCMQCFSVYLYLHSEYESRPCLHMVQTLSQPVRSLLTSMQRPYRSAGSQHVQCSSTILRTGHSRHRCMGGSPHQKRQVFSATASVTCTTQHYSGGALLNASLCPCSRDDLSAQEQQ